MALPQLLWDLGTAYDLFVSLEVLHRPAEYDVPAAWTAGVRARLPSADREILEQSLSLFWLPIHWAHTLPAPKDGAAVLWMLGQIPPAERLPILALSPDDPPTEVAEILRSVAARGAWDKKDEEMLQDSYRRMGEKEKESCWQRQEPPEVLSWWARTEEFGERYLKALHTYYEVFFAEEEKRIRPALQEALSRAQELAGQMALPDLIEELSQGLRFDRLPEVVELVLAPSYWGTPLVFFRKASAQRDIWLFGARPLDASLVPGEAVPDTMLRTLKALSDPTRLRILNYLTSEPLTPAELSRRLRLRPPTVTHHINILRLAGLVQLTLGESLEAKGYAARSEAVDATFDSLKGFLKKD